MTTKSWGTRKRGRAFTSHFSASICLTWEEWGRPLSYHTHSHFTHYAICVKATHEYCHLWRIGVG